MLTPKFADTHNLVAFLEKPRESNGFEEIIDFLNASSFQYALTVNPTIYTSCIEQFWIAAKVNTVNGEHASGTHSLPTDTIFEELAKMGHPLLLNHLHLNPRRNSTRRKQKKNIEVPHPSDSTADVPNEEHVPKHSYDPSQSGEDRMQLYELMNLCTKLSDRVLALETTKTTQALEIACLKSRVKQLEKKASKRTHKFKRLYKVGSTRRVESS
ncbi:hypothetical protein Tco_1495568, partial [Tanacetum coccineum]